MSNETTLNAAALKAADEIKPPCDYLGSNHCRSKPIEEIAVIIAKHFPAPVVDGVNRKLLEAANNAWHGLNLQANAPENIVKWRKELRAAITLAESAPASLESELAEALRMTLLSAHPNRENHPAMSAAWAKAKPILARYDARESTPPPSSPAASASSPPET